MKNFSDLINEGRVLDIQDDTLEYISSGELEKYLNVVDKFISDDAKTVVNYLITNNASYIKDLGQGSSKNALAAFYERPIPSDPTLKTLYKAIGALDKKNRLIEIPVFQTDEQFHSIINKKINPDEIFLDLTSERGRNEIVLKYEKLVNKIVNQYVNKSGLDEDQLRSAALEGLVEAMNTFGKNTKKDADEENDPDERKKAITFTQYAAYRIRNRIIADIRDNSRTVRVPISKQNKEKMERGAITRSNTISGDNPIKGSKSSKDENEKTIFDLTAAGTMSTKDVDRQDIDELLQKVYRQLEKHFDKKIMDIWYSCTGVNGFKKLKSKEVADKYNVVPSNITYYCKKVNEYIQNTPRLMEIMSEVYDLLNECLLEWDEDDEPYKLDLNEDLDNNYNDNE